MAASPLISVSALREALGTVTVLDVRWRLGGPAGEPEYLAGHLPGAAYVDLAADLADPPADPVDDRGRHPLPDPERFNAAMRRLGVGLERGVVLYDDWGGQAAARGWWLLRHYGHHDVRVLDGGLGAWQAAGLPTETGPVEPVPGDFHGRPGAMPVVDAATVTDAGVLVDARAPERFRGDVEPLDPVAGRIPGAVNVPNARNLDNHGHFRDLHELREVYAAVGVQPGTDVAAYCGSGVTATHDVLAMELLGVPAALYPGSFSGWVSDRSRRTTSGSP
jgi:thiosulfate/3-mercaptopyruvate sulfurtransferase